MMAMRAEKARESGNTIIVAVAAYVRIFTGLRSNARRLLAANLCINVGLGIFGVLYNLYLVALGRDMAFIGLLASVSPVAQGLIAPVVGWGLQRWGARRVMMAGGGVLAVGMACSALVTDGFLLAVLSVITGIAFATATIPASPYMMEHAAPHERSHLFSAYFAANTVGNMIGSLLSGLLPGLAIVVLGDHTSAHLWPDRISLIAGALVIAASVWLFWLMQPEAAARQAERPAIPVEEIACDEERLRRDVLVMLAATGMIALTMGATVPFFNVYFAQRLHAGTATIGSIYALSGLVCTIAAFLAPALGRWGQLRGFSVARLLTAPIFLLFWLHPGLALAAIAYMSRNAFGTISGALENTFGMEVIPARLRGIVASWRSFAFNGGWSLGSLGAGIVVARFGYDIIFVLSGILTTAGSIFYFLRFARRS